VSKRDIETGNADDAYIEILKGVEVGANIVVGPARTLRFLRDGDRVVKSAEATAKP
jgi:hypothetical protein